MANQQISIGLDITDLQAGTQAFIAAMQQQQQAVFTLFQKMVQYNEQGQETKKVIQGLDDNGNKFEATLKKVASGWELVTAKAIQSNAEMKKAQAEAEKTAKTAQDQATAVANFRNANNAERTIRTQPGFDFNNIDSKNLSSVETALARIRAMIESGSISLARFRELLKQVQANPGKILPNLTADEASAVKAIRTLVKGFGEEVPEAVKKSNSTFISLGGILRLLEAQVLKRIFATIEGEILQSVTAAQKFMLQIAEIRTISQDSGVTTEKWSQGLTELSNKFGNTQADTAEAAYQALSNQVVKGTDTFQFLATAMQFGQTTVTSATDSVNLLSGAMRSYNLPATEAERISGILFETINLGRVRGKEMADTFGRIGIIAADAGVKLEETAAAIALLTNRGIKFSDASTLLQNILLKLIRPTDEMKKLFSEWGVESGTAAIATFGFSGVLQRLDTEAQRGTGRLGDLLGQIRAIRGAVGLTGGAFNDFNTYLNQITNSGDSYNKAKGEIASSPGQQAVKEMTNLRNFFEQDFGEPFLKGLLRITNALGGVRAIIVTVVNVIQIATFAYLAWQVVQIANLPIMAANITLTGTWAAIQGGLAAAFTTSTVATSAFAAATWAALGPVSLIIAAFAGGAYLGYKLWIEQTTTSINDLRNAANKVSEDVARKREEITKGEIKSGQDVVEQTKTQYTSRFQAVLAFSTQVLKLSNEMKQKAIDNLKDITEQLKVTAGTYFDSLRKRVSDFNSVASESKQMIKSSLKESEDLPRRGGDKIFNEKLKNASAGYQTDSGVIIGDQKIDLIKKRISELSEKAREEFSLGTKEGADEARKLFNEVEKLQTQLFDQETEKQKRVFEFNVKRGQVTPIGVDADGKPRYEFTVKTAELEKQINATTEERLELENRFRLAQELRQADANSQALAEKERIRALQQQFMLLEKIDIFNKQGKLKEEFKGPGGVERAVGQFDERRAKILELAGTDPEKGFQVFSDLFKQRAALVQTVLQAANQEATAEIQGRVTKDIQTVDRLTTEAKEKIKSLTGEIKPILDGINQQVELYQKKILKFIGAGVGDDTDEKAEPLRKAALQKLEDLKTARDAFNAPGGRTTENATAVKEAIDALNASTLKYLELRGMTKNLDSPLAGDKTGLTVRDQLGALGLKGEELLQTAQGLDAVQKQQREAQGWSDKLLADFQKLPGAMEAMQKAATDIAPSVNANFATLAETAGEYAGQLERINNELRIQQQLLPARRGEREAPAVPGEMFGTVNYYSSGFVPRGSDRNPAMIADGESVITAQATAQFAPLLKAMNDGILPRYNQSSTVTNVGDITVNVSGGQTDEQSIRNIAQGMRRAIRRGQVTL